METVIANFYIATLKETHRRCLRSVYQIISLSLHL